MEAKEPYEKPELVVIELKAEEVLAVGCKIGNKRALNGNPGCGVGQGCIRPGS